jgi:hypothetical protein
MPSRTQLLPEISIVRALNAVAAGTTVQNGTGFDMQSDGGYDGVLFILAVGALTATQVTALKAQQSDDNGSADDYTDLTGTLTGPLADGDGNKLVVLDIFRPGKRYVRPVVNRATANAVIDGVIAIGYRNRTPPTAQGANVAFSEAHVSPAEGTA